MKLGRREVATLLDVDEGFLVELERQQILVPDPEGRYDRLAIERARLSWSMHHTLGVNLEGVEVALHLLERWSDERRRVRELLARLLDEREDAVR